MTSHRRKQKMSTGFRKCRGRPWPTPASCPIVQTTRPQYVHAHYMYPVSSAQIWRRAASRLCEEEHRYSHHGGKALQLEPAPTPPRRVDSSQFLASEQAVRPHLLFRGRLLLQYHHNHQHFIFSLER